jgi:hypothetical protein
MNGLVSRSLSRKVRSVQFGTYCGLEVMCAAVPPEWLGCTIEELVIGG